MSEAGITIKARLGDDLRRITLAGPPSSLTLAAVRASLATLFAVPHAHTLKLRYLDDDQDLITITADIELREAFLVAKGSVLRLELEITPDQDLVAAAAAAAAQPSPSNEVEAQAAPEAEADVDVEVEVEVEVEASLAVEDDNDNNEEHRETPQQEQEQEQEQEQSEEAPVPTQQDEEQAAPPADHAELPPYDEASRSTPPAEKGQQPPLPELNVLLNEFHYHRIIFQTALQATLESFKEDYATNHKPKFDEFVSRADQQRGIVLEAIERTLQEWKEDLTTSTAPQDFARQVSESLQEVGTLAAPFIAQIRTSLSKLLQRVFHANPDSVTSSEIMRELDTYNTSTSNQHETSEKPAEASSSHQDKQEEEKEEEEEEEEKKEQGEELVSSSVSADLLNPAPVTEDMPALLASIATHRDHTAAANSEEDSEVKVPSQLSGDFIYLDGYQQTQEADSEDRERRAQEGSETVWADEFQFQAQLNELVSMGFHDNEAIRAALLASNGDISAALDSLL